MNVRPTRDRVVKVGLTNPGTAGNSVSLRGKVTLARKSLMCINILALAACASGGGYPDIKDVTAVTEEKPQPGVDILTDPAANDRYNSDLEGWGDRLHAAGLRLCRFYQRTGMPNVDCDR